MDTNGENPFFNKNNQELNYSNNINNINDHVRGINIADRRADFMNVSRLQITDDNDKFAVSPGISPSGLFDIDDSVMMLPNVQALPSPTTGRCSTSSNLTNGGSSDIAMELIEEFEQQRIVKTEEHIKMRCEGECSRVQAAPNCKMSDREDEQKCLEDGYSWKKYGQKQVKGSYFPRSYYKCSNSNCGATKKVEGSGEGEISQITYMGHHNHPPVRKVPDNNDHVKVKLEYEAVGLIPDPPPGQIDNEYQLSPQSNEADHDQINGDPKRRKIREHLGGGHETSAATARSGREPRIALQIATKTDILEDGFRWRKYGQKVVKGNPNPRSYYKCTTTDCGVRKHVERAANDINSVVTTYEGKHNHGVPSSRTNNISANNGTPLINPTFSNSSKMSIPTSSMPPTGNRVQKQLPLYLQKRKSFLNYRDFYKSNLATTFGPPTIYPYSFSTSFNSLPTYTYSDASFMMNNTNLDSTSMLSVPLPSYNNYVLGSSSNVSDLDYNFHYNNYVLPVAPLDSNQGQEIKEEWMDRVV